MRKSDMPEALPCRGAIDLRGTQELVGNGLQPAIIMIMANGNSRQMLTTISEGRTVLTLSMKFGGRSRKSQLRRAPRR